MELGKASWPTLLLRHRALSVMLLSDNKAIMGYLSKCHFQNSVIIHASFVISCHRMNLGCQKTLLRRRVVVRHPCRVPNLGFEVQYLKTTVSPCATSAHQSSLGMHWYQIFIFDTDSDSPFSVSADTEYRSDTADTEYLADTFPNIC